jgi:hypothetical protein
MCAKNEKVIFFDIIHKKRELIMEEKEIKDIHIGVKIPRSVYEFLKNRAEIKKEKFMAGREVYQLLIKGMQLESKIPFIEVKDFRQEKRALIILNKIKKVIKEESENPSETLES